MNGIPVLSLRADDKDDIASHYTDVAWRIMEEIQALSTHGKDTSILLQLVCADQPFSCLAGLSGMLKTAHSENNALATQCLEVEAEVKAAELAWRLESEARLGQEQHIRYCNGRRYIQDWSILGENGANPLGVQHDFEGKMHLQTSRPWKDGGVYLITGGNGAIGKHLAQSIIGSTVDSKVVLVGRSPGHGLMELPQGRWTYFQADITKTVAVQEVIDRIKADFGRLNGIFHAAGIIQDRFLMSKTKMETEATLSPKVLGTILLDEVTAQEKMDFFICFSSVSSITGNVGQADYAAANGFMDAFAEYRNRLSAGGIRQGRALSINWPLWEEGGMNVDSGILIDLDIRGVNPIPTETAIETLCTVYAAGWERAIILHGHAGKLMKMLSYSQRSGEPKKRTRSASTLDSQTLQDQTTRRLISLLSEVTGLDAVQIDSGEPLEAYGIDSLMVTELNRKLEKVFRGISKTLFFQYRTLKEVAGFLVTEYADLCRDWTELQRVEKVSPSSERKGSTMAPHFVPIEEVNIKTYSFPVLQTKKHERAVAKHEREPIAIIGMSGKFPQARSIQQFWENLRDGRDSISEIPAERWSLEDHYDANPQKAINEGKGYCKWGGFMEDFAFFDPLFFGISPREAINMDPQERLLLQSVWETLEDAGYTREDVAEKHQGQVGVFVGITKTGYNLHGSAALSREEDFFPYTSFASAANRISYTFDFKGPSMPIDTMCSSSLTAIHEACEHLLRGDCELAVAGGVNLYLHPSNYAFLSAQRMLSKSGKCKSFGADADGFVPGEGVGSVLLKPLSRAIEDRDHIYALIRGTSINHGGKTNGYTVPNPAAQADLIQKALNKAGVSARSISYVEAHGTGTELGDPIEISGLTQAFSKDTKDTGFCAIGSLKSNIGHLEAAAGIAGLIKIALQMNHQLLVPSLHAEHKNPNIDFGKTPFTVQNEAAPWKRPQIQGATGIYEVTRRAGLSSFGAGGANAHIIMEEYTPGMQQRAGGVLHEGLQPESVFLIVLSAKNEERLHEMARNLRAALPDLEAKGRELAHIAYTLQTGREAMGERLAFTVCSYVDFSRKLGDWLENKPDISELYRGSSRQDQYLVTSNRNDKNTLKDKKKKEDYIELAKKWVAGEKVDWRSVYGEDFPWRIPLPVYPFAREKYWIPELDSKGLALPKSSEKGTEELVDAVIDRLLDEVISGTKSVASAVQRSEAAMNRLKFL
ncbi:thiolase-like protein [Pyronema omphalodes]|nr:thiolase-like protein [Pyronema omphalodes]